MSGRVERMISAVGMAHATTSPQLARATFHTQELPVPLKTVLQEPLPRAVVMETACLGSVYVIVTALTATLVMIVED